MKRIYLMLLVAMATLITHAAAPSNYYQSANGKKGSLLKTAMYNIIKSPNTVSYNGLWDAFKTTDVRSDGKIWDMYSGISNFTPGTDQAGSYDKEGDCYNREHSFPKSWFGGEVTPMYTDLFHLYPTDGYVNGRRSNHPFGETNGNTYTSSGGFSKLGSCTVSGYSGTVFEPNDEYKGDFARTYFYMVTCYENLIVSWYNKTNADAGVKATLNGTTYPGFQIWQLNMLLRWAEEDPVSAKETARNDKVYGKQGNRNPFIDYPGLEQYIWGSCTDTEFSYNNYQQPTTYSGYNEGGGQGQGGETEAGTDVIDLAFTGITSGSTSYSDWSDKSGSSSSAVYAGNSAGDKGSVQLRSNNSNSGIVSTTSGGKVTKVKVTWNSGTTSGRTLDVYGKNTAYSAATDLYNSSSQGTKLGSIVYGTSTELEISGSYAYLGLRSNSGAMYLDQIEITWEEVSAPKTDPSFYDLSDLNVDYGSSLTLTKGTTGTPNIVTDGTVTLTSSNEAVCTVNGLTISPVAVGTAIITINTAASTNYNAGSTMAEITVNAPQGKTTAMPTVGETATLDFTSNSWGLPTSSGTTASQSYTDDQGYTITLTASTAYYYNPTNKYLMLGKSGSTLTLPAFDKPVTQIDVVGNTGASGNVVQNIFVGETEVSTATTGANGVTNTYAIASDYQEAGNIYSLKVTSNHNTQIKSIVVHFAGNATIDVALNQYGYATYCSEYPLDFTNAEGYSAWQITGVSGQAITFSQITGRVKGGTGILLKGEVNTTITLSSEESTNELTSNLLYGTLAPTYVSADEYYGLSGTKFVKVNAGTVKAGKALLPASMVGEVSDVKALAFVFEETDQIESLTTPSPMGEKRIFNLAGQRLSKPQKGVNIINGKKVIIK